MKRTFIALLFCRVGKYLCCPWGHGEAMTECSKHYFFNWNRVQWYSYFWVTNLSVLYVYVICIITELGVHDVTYSMNCYIQRPCRGIGEPKQKAISESRRATGITLKAQQVLPNTLLQWGNMDAIKMKLKFIIEDGEIVMASLINWVY